MNIRYFKEFSGILGRDMEFKVFGDGGKLCLGFPPQNGRFYDLENFSMTESVRPWLDSGKPVSYTHLTLPTRSAV